MGTDLAGARVLIIEDDFDLRTTLGEFLAFEDITFALAKDGEEGLALLAGQPPPRLILLDLHMPAMDGTEFRRRQLENDAWSKIPVIVLSADRHVDRSCRAMKVDGFLSKPVDMKTLLNLIARWP